MYDMIHLKLNYPKRRKHAGAAQDMSQKSALQSFYTVTFVSSTLLRIFEFLPAKDFTSARRRDNAWLKFSKISSLPSFLYKTTVGPTFEKFSCEIYQSQK